MEEIRNIVDIENFAFMIASSSASADVLPPNVAVEITLSARDYRYFMAETFPLHGIDYNNAWSCSDEFTYNSPSGIKFKIKRDNGK